MSTDEKNTYRYALQTIACMTDTEMRGGDGARGMAVRALRRFLQGPSRYSARQFGEGENVWYAVADEMLGVAVGPAASSLENAAGWAEEFNKGLRHNPYADTPRATPAEARLRAALVGLVGSEDPEELKRMREAIQNAPVPLAGDRAVALQAIDALLGPT